MIEPAVTEEEIDLKALRSLCIVVVIDVLGFGILIPLIPYMAAQFGAPPETLFVLAIVAVGVQGGLVRKLAPRYGEHRLALGGIVCYVFGMATVAYGGALALVIAGPVYMRFGPASPYLLACVVTLQALWCILTTRRMHAAETRHAGA